MGFVAGKLLWLLFRFSTVLMFVGALGAVLLWFRRSAVWGRRLVTAAGLCLVLVASLPIHDWVLRPLEQRFPQIEPPEGSITGIILLGGAVDTRLSEEHGIPALNEAAERMTTFVMLARRYQDARLIFTGGSGLIIPGALSEADVARVLFGELGLSRPVEYEDRSRSTYENAIFLRDLVRPRPGETWILLTSAAHMPRAVGTFRAAGWSVLPWPVGFKAHRSAWFSLSQSLQERLSVLDAALHEWAGLLEYRALGRTDRLFPGPISSVSSNKARQEELDRNR